MGREELRQSQHNWFVPERLSFDLEEHLTTSQASQSPDLSSLLDQSVKNEKSNRDRVAIVVDKTRVPD